MEGLFEPGELGYLDRILAKLEEISSRIDLTARQLQSLAGMMAAVPSTQQAEAAGNRQITPLPVLTLPLSPPVLNQMINAANLPGVAVMGVDQISVLVPAGNTVTVTIPTRPGTVAVATSPIRVSASYYSSAITIDFFVDGRSVTSQDYQYSLTGEDAVDLGQYYYAYQAIVAIIANKSATDTTLFGKFEGLAIERGFFESFYKPIIEYGYRILAAQAQVLNGGQVLP